MLDQLQNVLSPFVTYIKTCENRQKKNRLKNTDVILEVSFLPLMCRFPLIIINPIRPAGVAPFSGATTGTGGRIRDVQSAGQGGHVIAGTAGYCFGNLHIPGLSNSVLHFLNLKCGIVLKSIMFLSRTPGYVLPWESAGEGWEYPSSFAPPLQVAVEASDGASDYGNKFGEPVLSGTEACLDLL